LPFNLSLISIQWINQPMPRGEVNSKLTIGKVLFQGVFR